MYTVKYFGVTLALLVMATNLASCGGGVGDTSNSPTGNGGTLTLTNAPASTGGTFVAKRVGAGNVTIDPMLVGWVEGGPPKSSHVIHNEYLTLGFISTGASLYVNFQSADLNINSSLAAFNWTCGSGVDCSGVILNQTDGTVTFSNTVLTGVATLSDSVPPQPITLDGTLNFTPASNNALVATPPIVSTVSPANAVTNVAPTSVITATFNKPMSASSINSTSFVVSGVTGAATYSGNTALFTPSSSLATETTYNAMITTGVQDTAGNVLTTDYVWTFTTGTASPPPEVTGNNSALLNGAVLGKGTATVSGLRKRLIVAVLGSNNSALTVGDAYAGRLATSSDYAYIMMPVTNTGNDVLCGIKLAGLTYRDSADAILVTSNFLAYVVGSVGNIPPGSFGDNCLAPGEVGVVNGIEANIYSKVAKLEFTLSASLGGVAPNTSVIPQSYTIQSNNLNISVKNIGSSPAQVGGGYHRWYLFDDAMQPLLWGFVIINTTPDIIPALGAGTTSDTYFYDGSGSTLRVSVDFIDAPQNAIASLSTPYSANLASVVACSASLSINELAMCKNENRNRRLEALETFAR